MDDNEDKILKDIRHFRGSLQDLVDYFKSKGIDPTPYKNVEYKYPKNKTKKDESIPYQTFESKTFLKFNELLILPVHTKPYVSLP